MIIIKGKRFYKLFSVLAVLFLAVIFALGALIATNYKNLGILLKVISLVETSYLDNVQSSRLIEGAVKGMVESLDDPYSVYLEPKTFQQLQEQIQGSFGGVGILVGVKDEHLTVVKPYKGTPADKEGIKEGDIIIGIDGKDASKMDMDTAIGLMRGPAGQPVKLKILREGLEEPLNFEIVREEISIPTVDSKVLTDSSIGYIVISQFTQKTPEEFNLALKKLIGQNIEGLIVDLRDNPGGELNSVVEIADNFIAQGPIVTIDFKRGPDQVFEAKPDNTDLPLVLLVNEGSASASEIFAGAIKDTKRGTLIGTKTFGKGIVQTIYPLDNEAGLKLTTARYLTPNKNFIHKKGITPDIVVQQSERKDIQMEKAVEVINSEI